jgi:alpha-tubulin suppressor-like RCC1 family protein
MPNQFLSPEGDIENYFVTEYWLIDQYVGDTLWGWGFNADGGLGDNTGTSRSIPVTTFAGGTNWKQVASGGTHTAAIKTDGTLWTWGNNSQGQLGINTITTKYTPVTTFLGGNNWKQVDCGLNHTAAIKTDGTLWTWGINNAGMLGVNDTTRRLTPVTTSTGGATWKQVAGGNFHTAAIKNDGTLWTWGNNGSGQLGDNTTTNRSTPVTTFAGGTNWKQVDCGQLHTAAIKTDGTLWTWGNNSNGRLGDNTITTRSIPVTTFAGGTNWKQVSCGGYFTSAIKTDGTLWTWGLNTSGQLGVNDTNDRTTPVQVFGSANNWKQVSCGLNHTAAIKTDGTLWTWGFNANAELGINNTTTSRCTPVTAFTGGNNWKQVAGGSYHTAAVTSGTDPTFFIS